VPGGEHAQPAPRYEGGRPSPLVEMALGSPGRTRLPLPHGAVNVVPQGRTASVLRDGLARCRMADTGVKPRLTKCVESTR
jgi:hypothetical protein